MEDEPKKGFSQKNTIDDVQLETEIVRNLRRALVKVLVLIPLAVLLSLVVIGPGGLVSNTPATRVGINSVLAFWISIPAAVSVFAYQKKLHRANMMLLAAFAFPIVVHIGSATLNMIRLSEPSIERFLTDSVTDLMELAILSFLLSGACVSLVRRSESRSPRIPNIILMLLIFLLPLAIFGGFLYLVVPVLTYESLIGFSVMFGIIAIAGCLLAASFIPRIRESQPVIDPGYFISALLLFAISAIVLLLNLSDPAMNWELAETMMMAAFLLLAIALGVPFLRRAGFQRRSAYGIIIGLVLMVYLPFLITIVIETLSLLALIDPSNLLAYSIIHIGAASLSAMMAILLYIYPKRKTSWNHYPLIGIFGMWCGIAVVQVILLLFPSVAPFGEPITPYNVGSLLTLCLLYIAVRWTKHPPTEREDPPSLFELSFVLFGLISAIIVGEGVNQLVLIANPALSGNPLSNAIILTTNLVIMFAIAYLIFLLAEDSKGQGPVELYVVFFLAMWILPNILKSYYSLWTAGWWVSEILLFAGLLAGPPLFAWLYVRAMREVQESHARANMYADLLMHDVSNYNQMMMTSLELLGTPEIPSKKRTRLADDGRQVISFSEQLISNVRLLSEADNLTSAALQPTSLVDTIVSALDTFTIRVGSGEFKVEFQPTQSKAFVMANEMVFHIFLNILYSALECRKKGETVTIGIHAAEQAGDNYWQIDIKAPGMGSDQEEGYSSSALGLLAARLMTESLNGHFEIETFARVDSCEGRLFSIKLPAIDH